MASRSPALCAVAQRASAHHDTAAGQVGLGFRHGVLAEVEDARREHGIGTAKIKWLEQETSHGTIMFSRRLRKAFDPKGLFNPSKIVGFGD